MAAVLVVQSSVCCDPADLSPPVGEVHGKSVQVAQRTQVLGAIR